MLTTKFIPAAAVALATCGAGTALAADTLDARLVGAWKIVSVYDEFADGSRRDTWGAGAQGLAVFTPGGQFSAIIVGRDRPARAGGVPSEPVGPAIAYAGIYSVDEATHTFTTSVWHSTFPQWHGQTLVRTIETLEDDHLKVRAAPITDAAGRQFVPHLELDRVK
ncbi:lipocalin-like domain-containing protein [Xanthobacter autotrophicus]|uniref:lipocalin-like domain-containing protein n=1 Tax=Xanthobacter autotrophicus TaxID=280 RepID=UPI001E6245B7|nr:lipocalin-like domain-containing protein [Xanthobacter autotrophicus]UDQ90112.1 lipocalin-like domain-containing protein [Xanthobacter autotrophicus]